MAAWDNPIAEIRRLEREVSRLREERDDLADRLSALLCDLTGGLMSKTGYSVSTMIQAIEAEFEKRATEDAGDLIARAEMALSRVEALADEWAVYGPRLIRNAYSGGDVHEGQTLERCARELRNALGGAS